MITEDDFSEVLRDNIEHSDMHGLWGIEESSKKCYELAKQMAISFGEYLNDVYAGKIPLVYGAKPSTPENLFDLYLQSKQNG